MNLPAPLLRCAALLLLSTAIGSAADKANAKAKAREPRVSRTPADLKIIDNITFKTVGDKKLDLMLFQPLEKKFERPPLVVYIHGGGFAGGDRTKVFRPDAVAVIRELNHRGFFCASVEYRLANGKPTLVNESVADCKDAVRFLGKHAAEYGFDPSRIGTFGSSAGGNLTLTTALGQDKDYPCDPALDGSPAKIRCVAAYYPITSFVSAELAKGSNFENPNRLHSIVGGPLAEHLELAKKLSPIELLRPDSPPIFLAHGDQDHVLSFHNSTAMRDAAQAKGVPVECIICKGADHGLSGENLDPPLAQISQRTVEFFVKYLAN